MESFLELLDDGGAIGTVTSLSQREAKLAFGWAQMAVVDELGRRERTGAGDAAQRSVAVLDRVLCLLSPVLCSAVLCSAVLCSALLSLLCCLCSALARAPLRSALARALLCCALERLGLCASAAETDAPCVTRRSVLHICRLAGRAWETGGAARRSGGGGPQGVLSRDEPR